jgi:hypothetical protein
MNEVAAAVKARFGIVAGDLSYSGGCCIPGKCRMLPRSFSRWLAGTVLLTQLQNINLA